MQIKRFEAKNMTEALRHIKHELGPEAVILSAKDIRKENRLLGISRKVGVEVTAAVDGGLAVPAAYHRRRTPEDLMAPCGKRSSAVVSTAMGGLTDDIEDVVQLNPAAAAPDGFNAGQTAAEAAATTHPASKPAKTAATRFMPVSPGSVSDHRESQLPVEDGSQQMHQRLQDCGLTIRPWPFKPGATHLVALVGSAGVGKTTSIAKLAAQLQYEHGHRVGMIALDHDKVGAVEQLQIYGDILQIPLEMPRSDKAWKQSLEALKDCNVVLVDTPAIGARRENRSPLFAERLRSMAHLETWLVIGADTQIESMQSAAVLSSDLDPCAVVLTKTDLSRNLNGVLEFLSLTSLPLACVANGPQVPGDLGAASYERFARLLLENGPQENTPAPKAREPRDQYLANRSSDIFHRPDCKWIRLINKENVVMFGSFAEALNNRFKPCRYCNPQHMSITGILHQEGAVH